MNASRGDALSAISDRYRAFAAHQARGSCELYERFAETIADSAELLSFVASLPAPKQQPNLVLAAVRWVCGTADSPADFARSVTERALEIRATILERSTQTNEPGRCATLLPILSALPQPLALLEVGASAGLCLYPDRYAYRYGPHTVDQAARTATTPMFDCAVEGPLPSVPALPEVAWRRGLDLYPVDLSDPERVRWLENLIWPSHVQRLENLQRAMQLARSEPAAVVTGDLLQDTLPLLESAPTGATRVVFHSAVLNYLEDPEARERFGQSVMDAGATWVSNEGPGVLPDVKARAGARARSDRFLLAVNGQPVALTGFHGQTFQWLDEAATGTI